MESSGQTCSFFLSRLAAEADRLSDFVFPGHHPGPRKWLRFVKGLIDTGAGYLQQSNAAGVAPGAASKLIQDAELIGNRAYELLAHMSGADANNIPHQIVAPFQRWVSGLGINNTIFFRAEHLPNYELARFDLSQYVSNLNNPSTSLLEATADIHWPVMRVTVPSHSMGMLPHFAVVSHELGHAIHEAIKLDLSPHNLEGAKAEARIKQRFSNMGRPYGPAQIILGQKVLNSWINEFKADAIGLIITGPAFFFALSGFLELSGQGYGISQSHPPSDLRLTLLADRLMQGSPSFGDILADRAGLAITHDMTSPHVMPCPPSDLLFAELSTRLGAENAAVCVELIPLAQGIAKDIYDAAPQAVAALNPSLVYTPEQLDLDLTTHLDLLCALVPPIEFRDASGVRPTSLASILNVGWSALLSRLDTLPVGHADGELGAARMERLNELLLKGVELSEARRLWDEQQ